MFVRKLRNNEHRRFLRCRSFLLMKQNSFSSIKLEMLRRFLLQLLSPLFYSSSRRRDFTFWKTHVLFFAMPFTRITVMSGFNKIAPAHGTLNIRDEFGVYLLRFRSEPFQLESSNKQLAKFDREIFGSDASFCD